MYMQYKHKHPNLSLVLPGSSKNPPQENTIAQPTPQIPSRSNGIVPAKQKRLFPVACRLVPMDQWFTTRVDRTWNVLDLKIWLLSKALPTPILPLPASYRPSSPVTFAAAPAPSPRPLTVTSYREPITTAELSFSTTLAPSPSSISSISPITFAAAPDNASHQTTSMSHESPQTPARPVFYPPLSSVPVVQSPASHNRFSFDESDENVPLYANSYSPALNNYLEDEDDEDEEDNQVSGVTPRSIPYSYNTGAPAISGLAALNSNSNKTSVRGYSASLFSGDIDLVRRATAIAKRWHIYSFSTGMLLSDDLPLAEYTIRPYELLEVHRAGAYVSLPRTILPGLDPSSHNHDNPKPPPTSTKTTRAYPSPSTRNFYTHHSVRQESPNYVQTTDARDSISSDSSDDEYDATAVGSPYAQPYFDGWVSVLRDKGSGHSGSNESGNNDICDGDVQPRRKVRRRGPAKSETSKSGRGKDRARMERDQKQPSRKEDDSEMQLQEDSERWTKRWMIIREGIMTLWKERKDDWPEERYKVSSCVALYGADTLRSILSGTSHGSGPFSTPHTPNANVPHASTSTAKPAPPSPTPVHHVICARFRQPSSPRDTHTRKTEGKSSANFKKRHGTLVVLKVADASIHEHLLRIFHRLSYSCSTNHRSPSSSSAASHTLHTRTLRTDFLPNPIPHPLSLSFSAPSPIEQGDESPLSSSYNWDRSDGSEYDDDWIDTGSSGGRSRRKAFGKDATGYVGLGRGVGVRYPEWREDVLQKAIHVGRGLTPPEARRAPDLSPEPETPPTDQLHIYGFVRGDMDNYATNLTRQDYDSDDSDSDAFSEAEWEGWAYDLDRPKVAEEIGTGPGSGRRQRNGLTTPQVSPASDHERVPLPGPASDEASSPSTSTLRPRSRSLSASSPTQATKSTTSLSSASSPPVTPGARARSSTISVHLGNSTSPVVESTSMGVSHLATPYSQPDHVLRSDLITSRTVGHGPGGVRSLMRGLSMRAGKESFLRGLENALDFVEGK